MDVGLGICEGNGLSVGELGEPPLPVACAAGRMHDNKYMKHMEAIIVIDVRARIFEG